MKTLFLVRHAKSSWDETSLDDIDRPLKASGVKDAYLISTFLKEKIVQPELIISSPAVRALSTAVIFAKGMNIPLTDIKLFQELYESTPGEIQKTIQKTDDEIDSLMVFGHDPSLTNLFMFLTGINLEKIPTSAVVSISLNIDHWKEIAPGKGILEYLYKPKQVKAILNLV
ncbi:MAG: histidine phosphatase family protein [Bacteroidota bacterium]|nr:histidine phosphatase family protein [Bacteroidota bacterium]